MSTVFMLTCLLPSQKRLPTLPNHQVSGPAPSYQLITHVNTCFMSALHGIMTEALFALRFVSVNGLRLGTLRTLSSSNLPISILKVLLISKRIFVGTLRQPGNGTDIATLPQVPGSTGAPVTLSHKDFHSDKQNVHQSAFCLPGMLFCVCEKVS